MLISIDFSWLQVRERSQMTGIFLPPPLNFQFNLDNLSVFLSLKSPLVNCSWTPPPSWLTLFVNAPLFQSTNCLCSVFGTHWLPNYMYTLPPTCSSHSRLRQPHCVNQESRIIRYPSGCIVTPTLWMRQCDHRSLSAVGASENNIKTVL